MHNSSIVKLQSNDGQVFEVAYGTIKQSQTMEALLEEFDYPEDVIPIPNINSATLAKVGIFKMSCQKFRGISKNYFPS